MSDSSGISPKTISVSPVRAKPTFAVVKATPQSKRSPLHVFKMNKDSEKLQMPSLKLGEHQMEKGKRPERSNTANLDVHKDQHGRKPRFNLAETFESPYDSTRPLEALDVRGLPSASTRFYSLYTRAARFEAAAIAAKRRRPLPPFTFPRGCFPVVETPDLGLPETYVEITLPWIKSPETVSPTPSTPEFIAYETGTLFSDSEPNMTSQKAQNHVQGIEAPSNHYQQTQHQLLSSIPQHTAQHQVNNPGSLGMSQHQHFAHNQFSSGGHYGMSIMSNHSQQTAHNHQPIAGGNQVMSNVVNHAQQVHSQPIQSNFGGAVREPSRMATVNSTYPDVPSVSVIMSITQRDHNTVGRPFGMDPFIDPTATYQPRQFGVIKISRIPYNVTKQDVIDFLGPEASIVEDCTVGSSIHIIMERPSTKTLDCFVEFDSPKIARDWFKKWFNTVTDVELKFKNRIATVEVSNQDELHRSLFPHAKGIKWQDGQPHKVANAGSNATFRGFLNEEELRCLWNSAERPHRYNFSLKALQRTFESMISILSKFPWNARDMYTVADRNKLFVGYMRQLATLTYRVYFQTVEKLNHELHKDFVFAGLNCVGFGERQKHEIMCQSKNSHSFGMVSASALIWQFDVLAINRETFEPHVKAYVKIIEAGWDVLTGAQQRMITRPGYTAHSVNLGIDYPEHWQLEFDTHFHIADDEAGNSITMLEAATYERELCFCLMRYGSEVLKFQQSGHLNNPFNDTTLLVFTHIVKEREAANEALAIEAAAGTTNDEDSLATSSGSIIRNVGLDSPFEGDFGPVGSRTSTHAHQYSQTGPISRQRSRTVSTFGAAEFLGIFSPGTGTGSNSTTATTVTTAGPSTLHPDHRRMPSTNTAETTPTVQRGHHNKAHSLPTDAELHESYETGRAFGASGAVLDPIGTPSRRGSGVSSGLGRLNSSRRSSVVRGRLGSIGQTIVEEGEE